MMSANAKDLSRWEGEGGTPKTAPAVAHDAREALAEKEEHVLRRLGAAVILQWNDLPTEIQRRLFQHAVPMGEWHRTNKLKERIARFLHEHKDDLQSTD